MLDRQAYFLLFLLVNGQFVFIFCNATKWVKHLKNQSFIPLELKKANFLFPQTSRNRKSDSSFSSFPEEEDLMGNCELYMYHHIYLILYFVFRCIVSKGSILLRPNPPIYLHLIFDSPVWNIEFDELDFFQVWTGFFCLL